MNTTPTLGDEFVAGMAKLNVHQWKNAIMNAFQAYSGEVFDNEPRNKPWLIYLDLVALMWGYQGERHTYIKEMENRLAVLMVETFTKDEVDKFTKAIGDFRQTKNSELGVFKKP